MVLATNVALVRHIIRLSVSINHLKLEILLFPLILEEFDVPKVQLDNGISHKARLVGPPTVQFSCATLYCILVLEFIFDYIQVKRLASGLR